MERILEELGGSEILSPKLQVLLIYLAEKDQTD